MVGARYRQVRGGAAGRATGHRMQRWHSNVERCRRWDACSGQPELSTQEVVQSYRHRVKESRRRGSATACRACWRRGLAASACAQGVCMARAQAAQAALTSRCV